MTTDRREKIKEKLVYVANNVKFCRVRSGLSQEQVGNRLNISRKNYCGYEVNPQKVKVETLQKIPRFLISRLLIFI